MSDFDKPEKLDTSYDEFDRPVKTENFGPATAKMFNFLRSRVVGQDSALLSASRAFAINNANLGDGRRPIATLLFTGPTGIGKTMCAEELARYIVGDDLRPPLTRIQCARFQEHHRISELIGSPAGYVRSDEPGLLSQLKIDEFDFKRNHARPYLENEYEGKADKKAMAQLIPWLYATQGPYKSVILFDEIEKAHPDLHNMLLHIVDEGELGMNDGNASLFGNSIIILTSNVGGRDAQQAMAGKGGAVGFHSGFECPDVDDVINAVTLKRIEQFFPPEFVGRLRRSIVTFRMLSPESCAQILDNMLQGVQDRLLKTGSGVPIVLQFTSDFKQMILGSEEVQKYGARPLRDKVEKEVTLRIANAIESGELQNCDEVLFDSDQSGCVHMRRKGRVKAVRSRAHASVLGDIGDEEDESASVAIKLIDKEE